MQANWDVVFETWSVFETQLLLVQNAQTSGLYLKPGLYSRHGLYL